MSPGTPAPTSTLETRAQWPHWGRTPGAHATGVPCIQTPAETNSTHLARRGLNTQAAVGPGQGGHGSDPLTPAPPSSSLGPRLP